MIIGLWRGETLSLRSSQPLTVAGVNCMNYEFMLRFFRDDQLSRKTRKAVKLLLPVRHLNSCGGAGGRFKWEQIYITSSITFSHKSHSC